MKYGMQFTVNVIDDSMAPKLREGDFVTVVSGAMVDDDHMAAVLVNDDSTQTTKLLIRKVIVEPGKITLKPTNDDYPYQVFVGEKARNVHILGIVSGMRRFWNKDRRYGFIVTAKVASDNRAALESNSGNVVCEPID